MKYGNKKILACLVMAMTLAPMVRAEDADLSTPKKAGVSFAKAVTAGDMAAVKTMSTGSDGDYALVKMISDLMVSMKNLEAASIKKFGADAKLPKEMAMDLAGDFASCFVCIFLAFRLYREEFHEYPLTQQNALCVSQHNAPNQLGLFRLSDGTFA